MELRKKFRERDIIYKEQSEGISRVYEEKKMLRMVTIIYDPATKKGKAIGQILDGIKRLL